MPVGDKDDGVRGRGGLDDDMVDVQKGLREAKTVAERPASLFVSVLRLQTLNKQQTDSSLSFRKKDALPKTQQEVERQSRSFQSLNHRMLLED